MKDIPITLIAAVNNLGFIGNEEGDLLIKNNRDLQRFKELSKNGVLIMGRKTYESLPKALPTRSFVVVTSNARGIKHPEGITPNQTLCVGDINNALEAAHRLAERQGKEKIVIAGGTSIFARYMLDAQTIYLTHFDNNDLGGARFPMEIFDQITTSDRMVKSNEYTFYDGEMRVTFEDYQLTPAVESRVGDFIKLRNGLRFRASDISVIAPLEDSVMIVAGGAGFHINASEVHLDTLLKELDRIIEQQAFANVEKMEGVPLSVDSIKLCANED